MKKLFPILLMAIFAFAACDDDDDIAVNDTIKGFIEQKYTGAQILFAEVEENGLIEVDINHDGRRKEVYFNKDNKWVYTTWDVTIGGVPDVVKDAVQNLYPDFTIDDIDYVERESGDHYEFDLEKGETDIVVLVSPDGTILN